jgi:hypothetical protein
LGIFFEGKLRPDDQNFSILHENSKLFVLIERKALNVLFDWNGVFHAQCSALQQGRGASQCMAILDLKISLPASQTVITTQVHRPVSGRGIARLDNLHILAVNLHRGNLNAGRGEIQWLFGI